MYCAAIFPHQSKLTRHILSHSLDSLKYRDPCFLLPPTTAPIEPLNLGDNHFRPQLKSDSSSASASSSAAAAAAALGLDSDFGPFKMDFSPSSAAGASAVDAAEGSAVVCKFCGQAFPDVSALVAHLPAHTGDRPFKCSFCGKAFKLRHHMKDHCRVHTGERPFRCSLCGKTFSRSTILKAHEKTHYPKYMRKMFSPSPVDGSESSQPPHPPPPLGSLSRTPPP
jgi:DNA-directed RNA polymerase subunit RPC12/RpoP